MKRYLITNKETGQRTRLNEAYDSLEDVGKYILMRDMIDDHSGKYNIQFPSSIVDFLESRVSHYYEIDETMNLDVDSVIPLISQRLIGLYDITDLKTNELIKPKEKELVHQSIDEIMEDAISFQELTR
jgi:hypothetical protein